MSEEGFFRRWSRLKATGEAPDAKPAAPAPAPLPVQAKAAAPAEPQAPARPLPTLDDVARLTPDADFSAFVAKDVDKSVQRLALKKLFADPHFNAVDGLDMYMSDYNQASPLAPAMLASLRHAPGLLDRLLGSERDAEEQTDDPLDERIADATSIQQGKA